jgi:hypothetical protein
LRVLPLAKNTPRRVVGMLERKIHDRHAVMSIVQERIRMRSRGAIPPRES